MNGVFFNSLCFKSVCVLVFIVNADYDHFKPYIIAKNFNASSAILK